MGRQFLESRYWDQYHQVQKLIPVIVAAIQKRYGNDILKIITTGHSLGGGLAQQAAYCCSVIKEVIVFNPSPVTGFMDVPKDEVVLNIREMKISRIYQQGEVLSYLRSFLRMFYALSTVDPEIIEYEVNFIKGNLIDKHSMREMALSLLKVQSR